MEAQNLELRGNRGIVVMNSKQPGPKNTNNTKHNVVES